MRTTLRLGRIAGIPLGMHWSVLVIAALLTQMLGTTILPADAAGPPVAVRWVVAALATTVFLGGLLAHEMAHALTARHYGLRVRRITLWLLGGVAELDGQPPNARAELLIAASGPATSLGIGVLFGGLSLTATALNAGQLALGVLAWLTVVNVILAVFNLLPGTPLDGGRVLTAAVWWATGNRDLARRVATRSGVAIGVLLTVAGAAEVLFLNSLSGAWLVLLGWFLIAAARAEAADALWGTRLAGTPVEAAMTTPAVCGYAQQTVAGFVDDVARRHPHRNYPVLGLDGFLTGMVGVSRLARLSAEARRATRLGDVQTPRERLTVVSPQAPLAEAARSLQAGGHRLAVVAENGHVCGVLSAADIVRAIELSALNATPNRQAGPLPQRTPHTPTTSSSAYRPADGQDPARTVPPQESERNPGSEGNPDGERSP
jgi:Zn-dependent protease